MQITTSMGTAHICAGRDWYLRAHDPHAHADPQTATGDLGVPDVKDGLIKESSLMGECTQGRQRSQLQHATSLHGALASRTPTTCTLQVRTCSVVDTLGQLSNRGVQAANCAQGSAARCVINHSVPREMWC
jgi:hypothetical protein